jgi:hypothetical protein
MKICFNCCLYESAGATETIYQYYLAGQRLGIDVSIAGFIAKKVALWIPTLGEPEKLREEYIDADWYPITNELAKNVDLFVFYFDNDNPFDPETDKDELDRVIDAVPRDRAIVIDADGKYNPVTECEEGDTNHLDKTSWLKWKHTFDSLSDHIFQPSFCITQSNVKFFPFFGYLDQLSPYSDKMYDVLYLGNNWHRWYQMTEMIGYLDELRGLFPRIGITGNNWTSPDQYWPEAKYSDPAFFEEKDIEVSEQCPPIGEVVSFMSKARYAPILLRPILQKMQMITPRMFETFAAGVIPIITNNFHYCQKLYGPASYELQLGANPVAKLRDMVLRRHYYIDIVRNVCEKLTKEHSFSVRLQQLKRIKEKLLT